MWQDITHTVLLSNTPARTKSQSHLLFWINSTVSHLFLYFSKWIKNYFWAQHQYQIKMKKTSQSGHQNRINWIMKQQRNLFLWTDKSINTHILNPNPSLSYIGFHSLFSLYTFVSVCELSNNSSLHHLRKRVELHHWFIANNGVVLWILSCAWVSLYETGA